MLTKAKKEKLREICVCSNSIVPKKAEKSKKELFQQEKEKMFEKIKRLGSRKVKEVSPEKANCIIKICMKKYYQYNSDNVYIIFESECYTRSEAIWVTGVGDKTFDSDTKNILMMEKCIQEKNLDFSVEVRDYYVKIN